MPPEKPGSGKATALQSVCPTCRTPNPAESSACSRCGDVLPKKKKGVKGEEKEFDATVGSFSPTCIIVPIVIILFGIFFLYLCLKGGAKPGTCEYNVGLVQGAVFRYNKKNPESKMNSLNFDLLLRQDGKKKAFLKSKPVCPIDSSAQYEIDSEGNVICSSCSQKKK